MCDLDLTLAKVEHGNRTLIISIDSDPYDPREGDNLGRMYCWHRGYILGDEHDLSVEEFEEQFDERKSLILPLYLYDHSGLRMNTSGFHCPWDSGQVGYIAATKEDIRKWFGVKRITKKLLATAESILESEVEIYDHYLSGSVYFMTLEEDGELVESIGGFFGGDFAGNGMYDFIPEELQPLLEEVI